METIIKIPSLLVNSKTESNVVNPKIQGLPTTILIANLDDLIKQRDKYTKLANTESKTFQNSKNILISDVEKHDIKTSALWFNVSIIKDTLSAANRFNNATIFNKSSLEAKKAVYEKKLLSLKGEKYKQVSEKIKKLLVVIENEIEQCKVDMNTYNKKVNVEIQIIDV